MQRHDDEVRNNVIYPTVICPWSSRHSSYGRLETTKHGNGKIKEEKKERGPRPTIRENQKAKLLSRRTRQQRRARKPLALFLYRSSYVNLPSFQKLPVAARLKATAHQAFRRCVQPIKRHPAFGPLPPDPFELSMHTPSGYRRIGFYFTFHQQTLVVFTWHNIWQWLTNDLPNS